MTASGTVQGVVVHSSVALAQAVEQFVTIYGYITDAKDVSICLEFCLNS